MTAILLFLGLMVPRCDYYAVTYDGNIYVVGSGETCRDATVGWVLPAGWREIQRRQYEVWFWSE